MRARKVIPQVGDRAPLRGYSFRERVSSGLLSAVFLAAAITVTLLLYTRRETRTAGMWGAALGTWGGVALFGKIALTGTSSSFFERDLDVPRSAPDSESDDKK